MHCSLQFEVNEDLASHRYVSEGKTLYTPKTVPRDPQVLSPHCGTRINTKADRSTKKAARGKSTLKAKLTEGIIQHKDAATLWVRLRPVLPFTSDTVQDHSSWFSIACLPSKQVPWEKHSGDLQWSLPLALGLTHIYTHTSPGLLSQQETREEKHGLGLWPVLMIHEVFGFASVSQSGPQHLMFQGPPVPLPVHPEYTHPKTLSTCLLQSRWEQVGQSAQHHTPKHHHHCAHQTLFRVALGSEAGEGQRQTHVIKFCILMIILSPYNQMNLQRMPKENGR